ncbi:hypothetical protein DFH09DRAFT_922590, partial [Mycena vulgaris]
SLGHMAVVDGFEKNPSGRRALRVGIDVSLWFHQIIRKQDGLNSSELGDNPQLRTLFFRLSEWPIIPLFVFDGRERPEVKRGSKMGKSGSHPLSQPMKKMLAHFGMQWREASKNTAGEAEAELACLNQDGLIDAIITDDCDALIFGGKTIIRNAGLDLSGNKRNPALDANGKASKHHVMVYTADAVRNHAKVRLTRGALLLFALLAGGDYHPGVPNVGKVTASGLARCGFGDRLLEAFKRHNKDQFKVFLVRWRAEVNAELRSNSRGHLKQRHTSLTIPPDFPDLEVLANYVPPVRKKSIDICDDHDINIPALAGFCENMFSEWGHRSAIIKRFRTLLWQPAVMHVLRRAALLADEKEREKLIQAGVENAAITAPLQPLPSESVGTPASLVRGSLGLADRTARLAAAFVNKGTPAAAGPDTHPLFVRVVNMRNHVSTGELLEFRAEVCPHQLVALANSGIKATRKAPEGAPNPKKTTPESESTMRMWIPATMLQQVHPILVDEYFDNAARGNGKEKGKALAALDESDSDTATVTSQVAEGKRREKAGSSAVIDLSSDSETEWNSTKTTKRSSGGSDEEQSCPKRRRVSRNDMAPSTSTNARTRTNHSMDDDIIDLTSD